MTAEAAVRLSDERPGIEQQAAFNGEGQIVSPVDKRTGCGLIDPDNRGNVIELNEDVPGIFDAWDAEAH